MKKKIINFKSYVGAQALEIYANSRKRIQGILVCSVIALAASFLSARLGGPLLLYALLLGLAFHFLSKNPDIKLGVDFCGRTVLRAGVALLGARITVDQVVHLGWPVALVTLLAVVLTIALGVWSSKLLGRTRDEGLISGGSVAICGASAALAVSSVLPQTKANERFTLLAVVSVTVLSTVAMVVYPLVIHLLNMSAIPAGVFLGGTIHDVAQVVAAGMMISNQAGDTATVVKLFRVMLLVPVVVVISLMYRQHQIAADEQAAKMPLIPGFLLVFLVMMLLASSKVFPATVVSYASDLSRVFLVVAIAAAGIKTSMQELFKIGWAPLLMFLAETLFIALFVLAAILFLNVAN